MKQSITIIGGGIGGLTLANALHQFDIPFELYERAPELTDVGAGIGLSAAPLQILDWMDLYDPFQKLAAQPDTVIIADRKLNIKRAIQPNKPVYCIHRARLIDLLKENLPSGSIHLSKELTNISASANETVLTFADGTERKSGVVVAADGIHSVIRRKLLPSIQIRYIGQAAWRGITDLKLPEPYTNSFVEIWDERIRFLTISINDEQTFWIAAAPAEPGGSDNPDTVKKDLKQLYQNYHPSLLKMIETSGPILRNDMGDLGTSGRPWHLHNVCFLGDAIHATTPNLAQGGCQAIEDAWCLALCLKKYGNNINTAFETYSRLRKPKTKKIVANSWMFGSAAHSKNPLFRLGFKAILTHSPKWFIRRQELFLNDLSYLAKI